MAERTGKKRGGLLVLRKIVEKVNREEQCEMAEKQTMEG